MDAHRLLLKTLYNPRNSHKQVQLYENSVRAMSRPINQAKHLQPSSLRKLGVKICPIASSAETLQLSVCLTICGKKAFPLPPTIAARLKRCMTQTSCQPSYLEIVVEIVDCTSIDRDKRSPRKSQVGSAKIGSKVSNNSV